MTTPIKPNRTAFPQPRRAFLVQSLQIRTPGICKHGGKAFTLPELLIAAAIGVGVVLLTGQALVSHTQNSVRIETLQRKRDDWRRASSFIESEIAMSERVLAASSATRIPATCADYGVTANNIKLVLDVDRKLPLVLYAVVDPTADEFPDDERNQWMGKFVLIRCGPAIGTGAVSYQAIEGINLTNQGQGLDYDDYRAGSSVASILIDGLGTNACPDGFCVTINNSKSVSFVLALEGVQRNSSVIRDYQLEAGNQSRVNPVAAYPESLSICDKMCSAGRCDERSNLYVTQGTSAPETIDLSSRSSNVIICGLGGGDTLKAGTGLQNTIDAYKFSASGATIQGGSGAAPRKVKNYLFGTDSNDVINGGNDIDNLVGRCGNDQLSGGSGTNHYLPWDQGCSGSQDTTITGGTGTDIVYIRGSITDYNLSSSCTEPGLQSDCTITKPGTASKISASNVEVFVFNDARLDLRQ